MMYFGMKLRALREQAGLTQDDVGNVIDVKGSTISQYERSSTYPSVERLIKLASYFHVSADYLLGLTDEERFDYSALTDEQAVAVMEIVRQFEQANQQNR